MAKMKNFLIMHENANGERHYTTVPAGTPQSAYNKWYKEKGDLQFVRVEDYNGVVYNIHVKV